MILGVVLGVWMPADGQSGCDSVVTLHLLYQPGEEPAVTLWMPNAFTPGKNGRNDLYLPVFNYPEMVEAYELDIYNRWGNLIFHTEDMTQGWDGSGLPEGVYPCTVRYKPKDNQEQVVKGTATLIR
jgi:gliding motility-associated-like protein